MLEKLPHVAFKSLHFRSISIKSLPPSIRFPITVYLQSIVFVPYKVKYDFFLFAEYNIQ